MPRKLFGPKFPCIYLSRASPLFFVTIENLQISAQLRNSNPVRLPYYRCKVHNRNQKVLRCLTLSHKGQHALLTIIGINPSKSVPALVQLPEARFAAIKM